MPVRLKPLSRQTILITGASSGIGLATARMAAGRGAAVLLVARDEPSLQDAVQGIRAAGGRAAFHVADVADTAALEAAADRAEQEFGGLDSWVNDAGVSIVGTLEETSVEDQRRLFETNYWGVVNGSLLAARRLRGRGGAIVNVGSVLSDRAMIYQGAYSASKHAVKGFTDALRMELEAERTPISVTLIKPSSIDTPYQDHARLTWGTRGVKLPPPVYDPRLVARAICFACEHPRRDLVIGAGGAAISLAGALFPRLTDYAMEAIGKPVQATDVSRRPEMRDNLHEARPGGEERSSMPDQPHRTSSLLLEAQLHPLATMASLAGMGALALGALAARRAGGGRVVR
ncbi:SDR family oxidoreductase, partial [Falsiroseomonas oryzae]|uniref:SDR family oxidoreductase n=1 Tax=Falsiroseomonas oryzae TaxID=2766473 RepID=UPI0022EB374D